MSSIGDLRIKRGQLKSRITRLQTYLSKVKEAESIDDIVITQLELRLSKFESIWDEFNDIQLEIEILNVDNPELEAEERESFEVDYFNLVSEVKTIISKHKADKDLISVRSENRSDRDSPGNGSVRSDNQAIKLPQIKLPTFKGCYDQWLEFRDSFRALIHENASLSDIQKFFYLRSSLQGDASQVIQAIEVSAGNYPIAWQQLLDRYENKTLIISKHVKAIFEAPLVTKESHFELRKLFDTITRNLRSLQSLGEPVDHWDTLIIQLIVSKLDPVTKRDWESSSSQNECPTMNDMNNFLKERCVLLEGLQGSKLDPKGREKFVDKVHNKHKSSSLVVANANNGCYFCKEQHSIYSCKSFLKLPIKARIQEIQKRQLCLNCLRKGHQAKDCHLSHCKKCSKFHNTLLHIETNTNSAETETTAVPDSAVQENHDYSNQNVNIQDKGQIITAGHSVNNVSQVLLSTALVNVKDSRGKTHTVRCLLDGGSQSNFITEKLCNQLGIEKTSVQFSIAGVGQALSKVEFKSNVTLHSMHTKFQADISCLILPTITEKIPSISFDMRMLNLPENLELADPTFYQKGPIDILLGSSIFWDLIKVGQVQLGKNKPVMQKTLLGWVIAGNLNSHSQETSGNNHASCLHAQIQEPTDDQLTRFWRIEEVSSSKPILSDSEKFCEDHFRDNFQRDGSGRFVVRIPFKENVGQLGDTKQVAQDRFRYLERKLLKNPELKLEYNKFMQEYEELGHMTIVNPSDYPKQVESYLPHHAVIKNSSITTKVRVVFNASTKSDNGLSLNDVQYCGPMIQDELFAIILRFRKHLIVVSADISKMYRQVLIHPDERCFQKIFWRNNPTSELECYELNTLTYGTTSAPFLAVRCLYQIAIDNKNLFPEASDIIENDFYMDDVLTGAGSVDDILTIQKELSSILSAYGFELRKWLSNNSEVMSKFEVNQELESSILSIGESQENKTLGVLWDAQSDQIFYSITNFEAQEKVTKRIILSVTAKIFDPLGLLGPVIILAKLIMQLLWQANLGWDEPVPQHIFVRWNNFQDNLKFLNEIRIPRCVIPANALRIELHAFSDASERAYGACIYIRSQTNSGSYVSSLLCAKSRVAPIKQINIPRLELCGAVLLSNLVQKVRESLKIQFDQVYCWTDSSITLAWIRASPRRWKTFVANRVSEIQNLTSITDWYHVKSEENPADFISRGVNPDQLSNSSLWWNGPSFFEKNNSEWDLITETPDHSGEELPEQRIVCNSSTICVNDFDLFKKYSTFKRLQRITALCRRFINNCKSKFGDRLTESVTVDELQASMYTLVKISQVQDFPTDYECLLNKKQLSKKSTLLSLNPFLDDEGLIRVGGRLAKSNYTYQKRHPILLPPKHRLTDLILTNEHVQLMHCGPQSLLASIREKFWPVSGRNLCRKITRSCITCFKVKPSNEQYLMGDLPHFRVQQFSPFSHTGVDYAGPVLMKDRKLRGAKLIKSYICLFICMCTKAVHLELVTDLTSDAFLATLKRFIARRGKPAHMYSDNATNFVGANAKLQEFHKFLTSNSRTICEAVAQDSISWHWIPPRSPSFGGLWESGIKMVKHHLSRVVGNANLNYEDLYTVLSQIEAILNSRPLCPLSSNPNDNTPLTPAHFLIGRSLTCPAEPDFSNIKECRLDKYQRLQRLIQHFWTRWQREYISELQLRTKWKYGSQDLLKIDSLVLVKDDNQPPLKWQLARVVKLHPGTDGVVRVATVKTGNNMYKRAVTKLCVLPCSREDNLNDL